MKKRLIEYIRDKEECNYADVIDLLRDLENYNYEQGFHVLANILLYVEHHDNIAHGDDMEALRKEQLSRMIEAL